MRGKLALTRLPAHEPRIIPAHAGQTRASTTIRRHRADHPRACGANRFRWNLNHVASGSSPRMRGKPISMSSVVVDPRIIPAHAGQTCSVLTIMAGSADHPRACGANERSAWLFAVESGSSPRMRGKLVAYLPANRRPRIIPAHAGQTIGRRSSSKWTSDHPRACGANDAGGGGLHVGSGSSPRMRGKPHRATNIPGLVRIIPAHAGQTTALASFHRVLSDHPRACGANVFGVMKPAGYCGSSPRMRGKRCLRCRARRAFRIIPAHAGQTPCAIRPRPWWPDHPRACGANNP